MTTIDDLKATEARLREAEADALASLHHARSALETAGRDDREAYAAALAGGEQPPKEPRTPKLVATIRDIEKRVLPAVDDALWQGAPGARAQAGCGGGRVRDEQAVGAGARRERSLAASRHPARRISSCGCCGVGRARARADRPGDRQGRCEAREGRAVQRGEAPR